MSGTLARAADSSAIDDNFSPIKLPESPVVSSPQGNLTGLPRVARDIAADIYNNIQKWNDFHIKGANIVKQIAVIKSDTTELYPSSLENLINALYEIVNSLCEVTKAFDLFKTQMASLIRLHSSVTPLFVSLSPTKLANYTDIIAHAYNQEFKVKQCVLENIAHTKDKDCIMFHAACWTYQIYITSEINLCLEIILVETGHRK